MTHLNYVDELNAGGLPSNRGMSFMGRRTLICTERPIAPIPAPEPAPTPCPPCGAGDVVMQRYSGSTRKDLARHVMH